MDWVRDGHDAAGRLLDDPVAPGALVGDLDHVAGGRVAGVAVFDVLHRRHVPGDVDGGEVHAPDDHVAAVGRGARERDVDVEAAHFVEGRSCVDGVGDPWDEVSLVIAVGRQRVAGRGWITAGGTLVGEDG